MLYMLKLHVFSLTIHLNSYMFLYFVDILQEFLYIKNISNIDNKYKSIYFFICVLYMQLIIYATCINK
jgi:hypothetical protein